MARATIAQTFDEHWKLDPITGCHEWQRGKHKGYGYFRDGARGSNVFAHRFAWERAHGPIPNGMHVCHRCDNPGCCNPEHLFLGTNNDNRQDSVRKERHARGDGHGLRKLRPDDVLEIRRLAASGKCTDAEIAVMFGIRQTQASRIISGQRWKHLSGAITNRPKPAARGERNVKAKLTADDVASIRAILSAGGKTYKEIAATFGVAPSQIWRISSGQGWRA
jgi:hypothetical protein